MFSEELVSRKEVLSKCSFIGGRGLKLEQREWVPLKYKEILKLCCLLSAQQELKHMGQEDGARLLSVVPSGRTSSNLDCSHPLFISFSR